MRESNTDQRAIGKRADVQTDQRLVSGEVVIYIVGERRWNAEVAECVAALLDGGFSARLARKKSRERVSIHFHAELLVVISDGRTVFVGLSWDMDFQLPSSLSESNQRKKDV